MLLLTNGWVVTFNQRNQVIEHGAIAIDGSLIREVGSTISLRKKYPSATVFDADSKFILPGMINAHTHLYSAFACGMPMHGSPKTFSQILNRIWWKLDRTLTIEDVYYSALVTGIQAIKSGTTTIFDHHSSPLVIPHCLDSIAQAVSELGLRANLCYEVSDRDGEKCTELGMAENIRWIKKVTVGNNHPLLTATFGLHASFTLTESTVRKVAKLGNELNSGFHIHLAEDTIDQVDAQTKYHQSVVARLANAGILGKKTIAAHGVHISGSEMNLLKKTDTAVIHNPCSNMNNAVGVAPIPAMLKKKILVGLGTDGLSNDMFSEARTACFIHKLTKKDPRVFPPQDAIQLAIENNRTIASRFFLKPLGAIAAGCSADLIIIDYQPTTPLTAANTAAQTVYGMIPVKVDTVFIHGKKILDKRKMITVNEREIFMHARKLAKKLWKRIY